jgi:murein DD-endopeptidase MepM/ murein hydrolase activator NlpD
MSWDCAPQCDLITQGFGCTDYPEWWTEACATRYYHDGIDISAWSGSCGKRLNATRHGVVDIVGYVPGHNGLGDRALVINADEAVHILYGHCERVYVSVGQRVAPGQHVADIGTRGYSDGCHLHFAVKQWGTLSSTPPAGCLDPVPYMTNAGLAPEEEDMTPEQAQQLTAVDNMTRKLFNMLNSGVGAHDDPATTALHAYGRPEPWPAGFGALGTIDSLERSNYNEIMALHARLGAIETALGITAGATARTESPEP